jgi:hypothetical protein
MNGYGRLQLGQQEKSGLLVAVGRLDPAMTKNRRRFDSIESAAPLSLDLLLVRPPA